jgi:hypothetical protein
MPANWTVDFWMAVPASAADRFNQLLSRHSAATPAIGFDIFLGGDNKLNATLSDGTNTAYLTHSASFAFGTPHHVALVRDSINSTRLFLDGVAVADSTTLAAPISPTASTFLTAGSASASTTVADLDELRIWTTSRYTTDFDPATDARSKRCQGHITNASLVGEWLFDFAAAPPPPTTYPDSSGNGHFGTPTTWGVMVGLLP